MALDGPKTERPSEHCSAEWPPAAAELREAYRGAAPDDCCLRRYTPWAFASGVTGLAAAFLGGFHLGAGFAGVGLVLFMRTIPCRLRWGFSQRRSARDFERVSMRKAWGFAKGDRKAERYLNRVAQMGRFPVRYEAARFAGGFKDGFGAAPPASERLWERWIDEEVAREAL